MGRREGADASLGALKNQLRPGLRMGALIPPKAEVTARTKRWGGGVAALRTSRKTRDAPAASSPELARPCPLPGKKMHLAPQKQHSGKDREVTAAARHGYMEIKQRT